MTYAAFSYICGDIDLLYRAIGDVQSPYLERDAADDIATISWQLSRLDCRSRPFDLTYIVSGA